MSRLSIRARLTIAFGLAMTVVLAGAGLFVYLQLRADLDEAVSSTLASRAGAAAGLVSGTRAGLDGPAGRSVLGDPEEGFAETLDGEGRVLESTRGSGTPALDPSEVREAADQAIVVEREVPGVEGVTRVLARPLGEGSSASGVLAVGQSLEDRDEALAGLIAAFAVGGPVAVVLASLIGYLLAALALRPVEAMRRRAAQVSLRSDDERLPLPRARDEVRRLGETLNDMLGRLARSFERERRFVADASHELRTPIAVLKTELEGALRAGGHAPEVHDALVAAVEECDHLAALAEDLLVVAHAAEGELPVRTEPLGAGSVLEDVRRRFEDRAVQRGREVRVEAPGGLVVQADPARVRQALGNLVDNALRHGEGEVRLSARSADGAVELEVADQGPGFGPEIHESAFERFTRGDAGRTRGGSGLGLAIVRAIAEAHGGSAEIISGQGARVRVRLPGIRTSGTDGARHFEAAIRVSGMS